MVEVDAVCDGAQLSLATRAICLTRLLACWGSVRWRGCEERGRKGYADIHVCGLFISMFVKEAVSLMSASSFSPRVSVFLVLLF